MRPRPLPPQYQPVRRFSRGEGGNLGVCPLEMEASPLPRGTRPCPGEGRTRNELGPLSLGDFPSQVSWDKEVARQLVHPVSWNH